MCYEFKHEVETVYTPLTDPDFLVERCLQLGEREASCDVEEKNTMTVVKLTRKLERDLSGEDHGSSTDHAYHRALAIR